jgi:hypothetical protein
LSGWILKLLYCSIGILSTLARTVVNLMMSEFSSCNCCILLIPFTIKGTVEGRRAIHKAGRRRQVSLQDVPEVV